MAFDPLKLGLESHYTPAQRRIIRRLIQEDFDHSGQKLPTYMKLVGKLLIPAGLPDEWLKKLLYQTLATMLNGTSTPRYEFWACLHLYLTKKYGDIGISETGPADIAVIGKALIRFGGVDEIDQTPGTFRLHEHAAIRLASGSGYQRVAIIHRQESLDEDSAAVYTVYEGAAVEQDEDIFIVMRNLTTRALKTIEKKRTDLTELIDPDMTTRLDQLLEAT